MRRMVGGGNTFAVLDTFGDMAGVNGNPDGLCHEDTVACAPHAWASAGVFALVEASLGLQFDHAAGEIRLNWPALPGFLEHVKLRGLRLDGAGADILLHRISGGVAATVTQHQGDLPVVVTH
jgi:glycogen debranching enzyme